jgi:hypothetical protein
MQAPAAEPAPAPGRRAEAAQETMDVADAYSILTHHTLGQPARAGRSRMPAPVHAPRALAAGAAAHATQQQPSQVPSLVPSMGYTPPAASPCMWVAKSTCAAACMC